MSSKSSSVHSLSSARDELLKPKRASRRVSITDVRGEQCDGLAKLKALKNYVGACEKEAMAPKIEAELAKNTSHTTMAAASEEVREVKSDIKSALESRSQHKFPRVNPFWGDTKRTDHPLLPIPKAPRTVEIRGGDILGQCECVKRNGLQHECPKWECRGDNLCLTWPMPTCQPSGLGAPIIIESKVKKPDPANCELTAEEKKKAERVAGLEKRKEEVRLVEQARANWKSGKEHVATQKASTQQKGYSKCNIHSGMYRLVPLMRNQDTQTPHELYICPCEDSDKKEQATAMKAELPTPSETKTKPPKEDRPPIKDVQTSTTEIPTAKQLKSLIKK